MSRNHPIQDSEQNILNKSFDTQKKTLAVSTVSTDGTSELYEVSKLVAEHKTIVKNGSILTIYRAIAPIGTALATAKWQAYKKVVDTSVTDTTDMVTTWADGDAEFDNVATDLTALTYS